MMLKLSALLFLLPAVTGFILCYPETGCFPMDPPFSGTPERPITMLPIPVPIQCYLYTKKNLDKPEELCNIPPSAISSTCFDPRSKTYVVIHGYTQSTMEPWMKKMAEAILSVELANVVLVDWSSVSMVSYSSAIQQIRVVGTKIANWIKSMRVFNPMFAECTTVIGHSLGGHMAGYIGKLIKDLGCIVAMDPASPNFEGVEESARLTKSDAKLVHVIHTNAVPLNDLGLGYIQPCGHTDLYINGGMIMPECPPPAMDPMQVICIFTFIAGPLSCKDVGLPTSAQCLQILADVNITMEMIREKFYNAYCSHFMAIAYYIQSILHSEKYCAQPCQSVEQCQQGVTQSSEGCLQMGHHAQRPTDTSVPRMYYLPATAEPITG